MDFSDLLLSVLSVITCRREFNFISKLVQMLNIIFDLPLIAYSLYNVRVGYVMRQMDYRNFHIFIQKKKRPNYSK